MEFLKHGKAVKMSKITRNIYHGPKRIRLGTIAAKNNPSSYRAYGYVEEFQVFKLRRGQTDAICYELVFCKINSNLEIAVWDPKPIDSGDPFVPDDYYYDPQDVHQKYRTQVIHVKELIFSVLPDEFLGEDRTGLTLPGIIID